jgi:menaquinol-cytochrome c reductase iron-sulfur subunit
MSNQVSRFKRRVFLEVAGKVSVLAALTAEAFGAVLAFSPQVLYEPPATFKIGKPEDFPEGVTFVAKHKLYLFRDRNEFHVVSATCTHLKCVTEWKPDLKRFNCSCHGSVFSDTGENIAGPAPKPLSWHPLALAPDGNFLVDTRKKVEQYYKFTI